MYVSLSIGEFILTKPKIQIKPARRQYSANESYSATWDPRVTAFVQAKKNLERPISQRWIIFFEISFTLLVMWFIMAIGQILDKTWILWFLYKNKFK